MTQTAPSPAEVIAAAESATPGDPYQRAVVQRDRLARVIKKLEIRLVAGRAAHDRADNFIKSWDHFATPVAAKSSSLASNPPKEGVARAVVEILLREGRPMNRAEVFKALGEAGVVLRGKEPIVVLSTMLWRMSDVVSFHKGVGYWPTGVDLPEAALRKALEAVG